MVRTKSKDNEIDIVQYSERDMEREREKLFMEVERTYDARINSMLNRITEFDNDLYAMRSEMRVLLFACIAFALALVWLFLPVVADILR